MARRPDTNRKAGGTKRFLGVIGEPRLEVDDVGRGVESWTVNGISGAQAVVEHAGDDLDERASKPRSARRAQRKR